MAILCALITTIGLKLDKAVNQFKEDKQTSLNFSKLKDDAEFVHWIETLFRDLDDQLTSGCFSSLNSETAIEVGSCDCKSVKINPWSKLKYEYFFRKFCKFERTIGKLKTL